MLHAFLLVLRRGGAIAVLALPLFWAPAVAETGRLTVSGIGQVSAAPDMATLTLGVTRSAPEAAEALAAMSADTEAVLARLAAEGIVPRDIQTTGLTVMPRWQHASPGAPAQGDGFEASTRVTVQIRNLDALGPMLAAVAAAGANLFQGLEFGLQDPAALQDAARAAAVAQARRKADLYARAADVTLGPLVALDEGGRDLGYAPRMAMDSAPGVPVAAGEIEITANVTLVFALAPDGD